MRLPLLLLLLLVGVGLIVVALLGPIDRTKYLLTAIGVLVSLIALGKSFVPAPTEPGLDELTNALALAMRDQWTKAATDRRLQHPAPLPIRWCRSSEPVAGPTAAATLTGTDHTLLDPLAGLTRITSEDHDDGATQAQAAGQTGAAVTIAMIRRTDRSFGRNPRQRPLRAWPPASGAAGAVAGVSVQRMESQRHQEHDADGEECVVRQFQV
ncbi:MAG TPA: hypothetical protein VFV67_23220 [Actinophytocola sp.]|uniref:hypothetical protein n=1 Tax=Actinophytocola sp. TaxID=1872138 RepID=UPI002DBE87D5|nr:hypothetical protein [Actinophytocola sp.]HEU5473568.1 hypothetical protein [Actinophytocola sp.]